MKCPNCGQEFEGSRCPNCGRPAVASPARAGTLALWVSLVVPLAMFGACAALGTGAVLAIFLPLSLVLPWALGLFGVWLVYATVRAWRNLRRKGR